MQNKDFDLDEEELLDDADGQKNVSYFSRNIRAIVVISTVFFLILGALWYYFFGSNMVAAMKEERERKEMAERMRVEIKDLESMIIPLETPGDDETNTTFAKLDVSLEIKGVVNLAAVNARKERIADIVYQYVRGLRPDDLRGSIGLHRLRREIVIRVNTVIAPARIEGVLFKDLIVQ